MTEAPTVDLSYRERLTVPIGWWALAALFCGTLGWAVGYYLGWVAAAVAFGGPMLVVAAVFVGYGRLLIEVSGDRLTVGRAQIELRYLSAAVAHDAESTRRRRGPDADARAYLALRPYVSTTIEVTLDDPADPAPYWLVSTRTPKRLASVLTAALARRSADPGPTPE